MDPMSAEDNYKGISKKIRAFFTDSKVFNRTQEDCETFLDQSLGCLEEYTWRFSGKIRKRYTADTRNYSNMCWMVTNAVFAYSVLRMPGFQNFIYISKIVFAEKNPKKVQN